ncbi:MAG: peptidase C39 family protein [Pseudomonadota bacterium]
MPRYTYTQTEPHSCGAAALMVAMAELGALARSKISQEREMRIYKRIWQAKGDDSNIAKTAKYTRRKWDRDAVVHENLFITSKLKENKDFQLQHALYDIDMKAAGVSSTTAWGMADDMFDDDARVLLVVAFPKRGGGIGLHFLLARKDEGQVWLMNPDGGLDHAVPKFGDWIECPWHAYTDRKKHKYIFTGVYVILR